MLEKERKLNWTKYSKLGGQKNEINKTRINLDLLTNFRQN